MGSGLLFIALPPAKYVPLDCEARLVDLLKRFGVSQAKIQESISFRYGSARISAMQMAHSHSLGQIKKAIAMAKQRGLLTPAPCEVCGLSGKFKRRDGVIRCAVDAHHDDYNFPLSVRWLCGSHHAQWHGEHTATPLREEHLLLTAEEYIDLGISQRATSRAHAKLLSSDAEQGLQI